MRRLLPLVLGLLLPALAWGQAQVINGNRVHAGWINYGITAGTATAYTLTFTPALQGYVTGQCFLLKPHLANTGAATLNVQGLGAKPLEKLQGSQLVPLVAGDLRVNRLMQACYDGTAMQLMGPVPDAGDAAAHGVVCDGVTQTAAAIQALLDTVPVGTRAELPAGVCLLNQTLTLTRPVSLEGTGINLTTLRQTVPNIPVVAIGVANDVYLGSFTADHSGTPVAGGDGVVVNVNYLNHAYLNYIAADRNWRGFVFGCIAYGVGSHLQATSNNSNGFEFVYPAETCGAAQWAIHHSLSQLNKGWGFGGQNVGAAGGIGPFLYHTHSFGNEFGGYVFLGSPGHPINDLFMMQPVSSADNRGGIFLDTYGGSHVISNAWIELTGQVAGVTGFPIGWPTTPSVPTLTGHGFAVTSNNLPGLSILGGFYWNNAWSGIGIEAPQTSVVGGTTLGNGRALDPALSKRAGVYIGASNVLVSGHSFQHDATAATLHYIHLGGTIAQLAIGQNAYAPGIPPAQIVDASGATLAGVSAPAMVAGVTVFTNRPDALGLALFDALSGPTPVKYLRAANGNLEVVNTAVTQVISTLSDTGTPGWPNRRGQVVIADANTTATVTLAPVEPDSNYFVQVTAVASTGGPAVSAHTIVGVNKAAGSFQLVVGAAPGSGKSIFYDWFIYR